MGPGSRLYTQLAADGGVRQAVPKSVGRPQRHAASATTFAQVQTLFISPYSVASSGRARWWIPTFFVALRAWHFLQTQRIAGAHAAWRGGQCLYLYILIQKFHLLNLATAVYIYAVALNLEGTGTYTKFSTLTNSFRYSHTRSGTTCTLK